MRKFYFLGELEFMEENRVVFDEYGVRIVETVGNRAEDGQHMITFIVQTDETIADMIDDAILWNDEYGRYNGYS